MPKLMPKLPQAVLSQDCAAFLQRFSIDDFGTFEGIAGRPLTLSEREELTAIARQYLLARAVEMNSPTVPQLSKYLESVRNNADALRSELELAQPAGAAPEQPGAVENGRRPEVDPEFTGTTTQKKALEELHKETAAAGKEYWESTQHRDPSRTAPLAASRINQGLRFAADRINRKLKDRPMSRRAITGTIDLSAMILLLRDLMRACDAEIRAAEGMQRSWIGIVRNLEAWAKAANLSTAVSKRLQGKNGPLRLSPFTALVKAVQISVPDEYRQHMHSDDALSKAVWEAKRDAKSRDA